MIKENFDRVFGEDKERVVSKAEVRDLNRKNLDVLYRKKLLVIIEDDQLEIFRKLNCNFEDQKIREELLKRVYQRAEKLTKLEVKFPIVIHFLDSYHGKAVSPGLIHINLKPYKDERTFYLNFIDQLVHEVMHCIYMQNNSDQDYIDLEDNDKSEGSSDYILPDLMRMGFHKTGKFSDEVLDSKTEIEESKDKGKKLLRFIECYTSTK